MREFRGFKVPPVIWDRAIELYNGNVDFVCTVVPTEVYHSHCEHCSCDECLLGFHYPTDIPGVHRPVNMLIRVAKMVSFESYVDRVCGKGRVKYRKTATGIYSCSNLSDEQTYETVKHMED